LGTSDEYPDEYTQNRVYEEGPRSDGKHSPKTSDLSPWFVAKTRQMPCFCSNMKGPRVDLRRVAQFHLLEPPYAYI